MTEWHVQVDVAGQLTDEQAQAAADGARMAHFDNATNRGELRYVVAAANLAAATRKALTLFTRMPGVQTLLADGTLTAEGIQVQTAEAHARTLPLLGAKEAAARLGISAARLRHLRASHPDFPAPVAEVAGGQLYEAGAIDAFAARWARRPGRPPKAETA
jgi:hypothetical protein